MVDRLDIHHIPSCRTSKKLYCAAEGLGATPGIAYDYEAGWESAVEVAAMPNIEAQLWDNNVTRDLMNVLQKVSRSSLSEEVNKTFERIWQP